MEKKRMLRSATLLLIMMIIAGMLAACAGGGQTITTTQPAKTTTAGTAVGTTATTKPAEKIKLSWATWVAGPVDKDNNAKKVLEKTFPNLELDMWALERATWVDQINTRVAGGEIPDIIYRDGNSVVVNYVKQKILAEVPMTLVKEQAKNIYQASVEYGLEVWLACNVDGVNYGLPIMQPAQKKPFTNGWRKDWLDKVGITKVPETIAEFEDAFRKFTKNDPDGNGKNDTYGMSFRGKDCSQYFFVETFGAYGVLPNQWMLQKDGTLKFASVTEGAKQALTTLSKWYKEGLIDPEFVTTDNAIIKQKWANSLFGYINFSTWSRLVPGGEYYEPLMAVNPKAQIVMGPAPKGPDGSYGYMNWGSVTSSIAFGKQLATNQPKFNLALQLIDRCASDQALYGLIKYGVEGENWKRNSTTNAVEPIAPYNDVQKTGPLGIQFIGSLAPVPKVQDFYDRKDAAEITKYATLGTIVNGKDYFSWVGLFTDPEVSKKAADATLVTAKWTIDFITGAKSLDQFDAFVKAWEDAGGKLLTEDYNKAYKNGAGKITAITGSLK